MGHMSEEKHLFCLKTLNGDLSMTIHTKQITYYIITLCVCVYNESVMREREVYESI